MSSDVSTWWRWTVAATLGEVVGFAAPALAGAATSSRGPAVAVPALVAAGFFEGSALGFAQSTVLRDLFPSLRRRTWTVVTGVAAATAWLLGMLPSTLAGHVGDAALWLVVGLAAPILLFSIGAAQWLVLRRYRPGSAWWMASTAAAWTVGLLVFVGISSPLWHPSQEPVVIALIGVLAGAAMAFTTAALTGLAAVRLRQPIATAAG